MNNYSENVIVWIIEDNDYYRKTIEDVINVNRRFRCKGSFSSCEQAITALEIEPLPDLAPLLPDEATNDGLTMPNFYGKSYRQVLQIMEQQKLNFKLSGSGRVVEQNPTPGQVIRYDEPAWIRFGV